MIIMIIIALVIKQITVVESKEVGTNWFLAR